MEAMLFFLIFQAHSASPAFSEVFPRALDQDGLSRGTALREGFFKFHPQLPKCHWPAIVPALFDDLIQLLRNLRPVPKIT